MELSLNFRRLATKSVLFPALNALALAFLFCVIYAQSPLYTSNQNQYFLHGLADAGFGYLDRDWLANTLDPTPVFSLLVNLTYRLFGTELLFYGYYALLLGIYLYSLLGIGKKLSDLSRLPTLFAYLALLLLLHSAALRFFMSRALGPEWTYLFEGGIANQRVLGAVLQPSSFGVFLLLSIDQFLERRIYLASLAAAIAVAFHPTYLMSAAILTLAYMWVLFREWRDSKQSLSIGLLTFALVLPVLIYVYSAFGSTPPETTDQARQILVEYRIPHHAVISNWFDLTTVIQIVFVLVAAYLARRSRLFAILALGFLVASVLTLIQWLTNNAALALLFPWRISVILVPLSVAVIAAEVSSRLVTRLDSFSQSARNRIPLLSAALILIVALVGATRFTIDLDRKASAEDRPVMAFVAANKSPQDVYLIPVKMQDFRLATGAPVYVDFKAIPYQDAEVLEWYRRVQLAEAFYESKEAACSMLKRFATLEGVTHLVLESGARTRNCDQLDKLYEDGAYGVYRLVISPVGSGGF